MENLSRNYEEENNKYINTLSKGKKYYNETRRLFGIINNSKKNSTQMINNTICENERDCINYLNSQYNIFDSGIEFAYRSCISEINNLYMDYKKLKDKKNITEIRLKIVNANYSQFNHISLGINNLFIYVKKKLFLSYQNDQIIFKNKFNYTLALLILISIIISILIILFVNIFIFITISRFSRPIKESTYRINCSFYYIKNYRLTK